MPAEYRVILMPEAFEDIDEIVDYIKQVSPQSTAGVIQRLQDATQSLQFLPHRYKVHRSTRRADRVIRSMPVPPWVVYYRIIEQPPTVRVLTIRHGARRQPKRFP